MQHTIADLFGEAYTNAIRSVAKILNQTLGTSLSMKEDWFELQKVSGKLGLKFDINGNILNGFETVESSARIHSSRPIKAATFPVEVIHEGDDEEGNPTSWAVEMTDENGKHHWIWIEKGWDSDDEYMVIDSRGNNLADGLVYKTFRGVKAKAFEVARLQEAKGYFSD